MRFGGWVGCACFVIHFDIDFVIVACAVYGEGKQRFACFIEVRGGGDFAVGVVLLFEEDLAIAVVLGVAADVLAFFQGGAG